MFWSKTGGEIGQRSRGKGTTEKRRTKQESLEACRVRRRIEAHEMAKELGVTLEDLGMQ